MGEGQMLRGHKVILASFSTVFEEMFDQFGRNDGGKIGSNNAAVYCFGISYQDLSAILDFIYQGEVSIDEARMPSFLSAAEELKIVGIYDKDGGDDQDDPTENEKFDMLDKRSNGLSKSDFNFSSDSKNFNKYSK